MRRLLVDTGGWIAHLDRKEKDHARMVAALKSFQGRLVTSDYVFDESVTLCVAHMGHAAATRLGDSLLSAEMADLVHVSPDNLRAAWKLFRARPDKDYSFTDCTSFVLMRALGIEEAATLDDDSRREGFRVLPG